MFAPGLAGGSEWNHSTLYPARRERVTSDRCSAVARTHSPAALGDKDAD